MISRKIPNIRKSRHFYGKIQGIYGKITVFNDQIKVEIDKIAWNWIQITLFGKSLRTWPEFALSAGTI